MKYFTLFILPLFLCASCNQNSKSNVPKEDLKTTVISHAEHLEIFDEDSIVKIHIKRGNDLTLFKLILSNNALKSIPEGYQFVQTPITQIAALSSTQIGMLDKIGSLNLISAVSNKKYIYNPLLLSKIDNNEVSSLGDEGTIPAESIVRSKSKFVFYSDFGQDFPHSTQLASMGIVCIPNPDWRETHPLGKAEWIKFFGYLTGNKENANSIFQETVSAYNQLLNVTKNTINKPTVTSGNMIGDIWYAPAGKSYNAMMLDHAGAKYIYSNTNGTGSIERTAEQVIGENQKTKFWINPGFKTKREILTNFPKLKHLPMMKDNYIYCYSAQMNKFWELGASEPHHVLEDLIRIFHPDLLPAGKMYFYTVVH